MCNIHCTMHAQAKVYFHRNRNKAKASSNSERKKIWMKIIIFSDHSTCAKSYDSKVFDRVIVNRLWCIVQIGIMASKRWRVYERLMVLWCNLWIKNSEGIPIHTFPWKMNTQTSATHFPSTVGTWVFPHLSTSILTILPNVHWSSQYGENHAFSYCPCFVDADKQGR